MLKNKKIFELESNKNNVSPNLIIENNENQLNQQIDKSIESNFF